jgi:hypothetical protein
VVNRCWLCESDRRVGGCLQNVIFFSRFRLCWVMPDSIRVIHLFTCLWSVGHSRSTVVWKMVPLCLMWCIWRERNARCFEESSMSFEEILHYVIFTLYTWTARWLALTVISFSDFLSRFSFPLKLSLVYFLYTLGCASMRHIYIYFDLLKKKKNAMPQALQYQEPMRQLWLSLSLSWRIQSL